MNKDKEEIFFELCNAIYELFSINQIHLIQDLRKPNILLSLLKEM